MIEFGGKGGMMMDMLTPGEQRLDYLIRALPANEKLYLWCYNRKGQLIAASNPDDLLPDLFVHLGAYDKMRAAADRVNTRPLLIGSAVGMQWVLIFQQARNRELMFVIGPVSISSRMRTQSGAFCCLYRPVRKNGFSHCCHTWMKCRFCPFRLSSAMLLCCTMP